MTLKVGQRVRIEYFTQSPIEAMVIDTSDPGGFVEVEQDWNGNKVQFIALESKCTVIENPT